MAVVPMAPATRILLAEDDAEMRGLLAAYLEIEGYEVRGVGDGGAAMRLIAAGEFAPDLLITDVHMPTVNGLELLRRLRDRGEPPPTIVITSFGDRETHARARALGAVAVFDKPFDSLSLVKAVNALFGH